MTFISSDHSRRSYRRTFWVGQINRETLDLRESHFIQRISWKECGGNGQERTKKDRMVKFVDFGFAKLTFLLDLAFRSA